MYLETIATDAYAYSPQGKHIKTIGTWIITTKPVVILRGTSYFLLIDLIKLGFLDLG